MIETGLKEKVVVVTGGASGIGRATAQRFLQEGCRVACWDVQEGQGEPDVFFQKVDVTNTASVESAVTDLVSRWGTVNVLINNAGILRDGQLIKWKDGESIGSMSDEQFDSLLAVNLRGVFVCTRAVLPYLIKAGGGAILNA